MPKDFRMDRDGNIHLDRLVEGADFTEQSLWIRLGLWAGDWFRNNTLHVQWELGLSYTPPRLTELRAQIADTALGTHGVSRIETLNYSPPTEGRTGDFLLVVDTIYGTQITIQETIGA